MMGIEMARTPIEFPSKMQYANGKIYQYKKDLEDAAAAVLPKAAWDYYKSGATDEQSLSENKAAFKRYIFSEVTKNLVLRAEKAGFKAIALTVDTPVFGLRRADIRNKFALPSHLRLPNFEGHLSTEIRSSVRGSSLNEYLQNLLDKNLTWDKVKCLKSITNLPIVAKGILRDDDALKAVEAGCSAILVSNHGARQLDGVPATIESLPEVMQAVKCCNCNVEVYLDGGVTSGTDVYKALALGAQMVFVGRPILWGLAVGGQNGVQRMLNIFRTELQYTFQIAGTPTVADVSKDMVRHESTYRTL